MGVLGIFVGVDDGAGGVDEGTGFIRVEGVGDVGGGAALGAVAGDEEEGVGECGAEGGELGGVGGADDGAEGGVAAGAAGGGAPLFDEFADVEVEGVAVLEELVLDLGGAGVGGADEDEEAFSGVLGEGDEGSEGVVSHVGIDGEGVGSGEIAEVGEVGVGEVGEGVAFGGVADVGAFGVVDDEEAMGVGFLDDGGEAFDAVPVVLFEEGGVDFDGGDVGGDDFEEAGAEFDDGIDAGLSVVFIVEGFLAGDGGGELVVGGVEADDEG